MELGDQVILDTGMVIYELVVIEDVQNRYCDKRLAELEQELREKKEWMEDSIVPYTVSSHL